MDIETFEQIEETLDRLAGLLTMDEDFANRAAQQAYFATQFARSNKSKSTGLPQKKGMGAFERRKRNPSYWSQQRAGYARKHKLHVGQIKGGKGYTRKGRKAKMEKTPARRLKSRRGAHLRKG